MSFEFYIGIWIIFRIDNVFSFKVLIFDLCRNGFGLFFELIVDLVLKYKFLIYVGMVRLDNFCLYYLLEYV